jgi:ferredoxin-NADP reductase
VTEWQTAKVIAITPETPTAKTFRFALPEIANFQAGQHYIVRLTAPDGYSARRSYSVASAPDGSNELELTIERLPKGEVSMFMHDEVVVGDEIDLRGPIGQWFVWNGDSPALLVGGGSGVVPLMAMLRLARKQGASDLLRLLVSTRTPGDLYYANEIDGPETTIAYTRATPANYARSPARLNAGDIPVDDLAKRTIYVCGSPRFCDGATDLLLEVGAPTDNIRVERFGPSG